MENNNNKEVKEEIKQVKEDIKDVKDEKKDLKDNEMSQNNWSFSGLWGSATKVIQDNQNMQYLQTNLTSVRSAINELSEKVQTSPNTAYLNTTINKLGSEIKELTKESVTNVMNTLKSPTEYINQLTIYLICNQDVTMIQNDIQQLWDHILDDKANFKKIVIKDGRKLLTNEGSGLNNDTLKLLDVPAPGLNEGYNVAKFKVEKANISYELQKENQVLKEDKEQKNNNLFKNLETQLMIPTKESIFYLCIQIINMKVIEDNETDILFCLTLYDPALKLPIIYNFSQFLPKSITTLINKNDEDILSLDKLSEEQQTIVYQIIQFAIQQLLTDLFSHFNKIEA